MKGSYSTVWLGSPSVPGSVIYQPSEGGQIVLFKCLDLYHKLPDFGERQCKSRIYRRRCDPPCGQARRRGRSGPSPMIGVPRSPHLFTTHCRNPQESLQDKACEDSCGDGLAACHRQCKGAAGWGGTCSVLSRSDDRSSPESPGSRALPIPTSVRVRSGTLFLVLQGQLAHTKQPFRRTLQ